MIYGLWKICIYLSAESAGEEYDGRKNQGDFSNNECLGSQKTESSNNGRNQRNQFSAHLEHEWEHTTLLLLAGLFQRASNIDGNIFREFHLQSATRDGFSAVFQKEFVEFISALFGISREFFIREFFAYTLGCSIIAKIYAFIINIIINNFGICGTKTEFLIF